MSVSILLASSPARSEALAAEVAYGENVRIQSLELDFDWCRTCQLAGREHTSLAWGFAAQAMQGHRPHEVNDNLFAPGSMPYLRYGWRDRNGGLFVQGGITVRLVSRTRLYNEQRVCTHRDVCEVLGEGGFFLVCKECTTTMRIDRLAFLGLQCERCLKAGRFEVPASIRESADAGQSEHDGNG